MALPLEDYALIGDCEIAALVGRNGSIDWLCWPRFDSDACFAALIGTAEHGYWSIAPVGGDVRTTWRYLGDTLILETRHETPTGVVTVVDFMPPRGAASDVVRLVRGERGVVTMRVEWCVRFGYGAQVPWVTQADDGALHAVAGPDRAMLRTPVQMRGEGLLSVGEFPVGEGQVMPFVMTYGRSWSAVPAPIDPNVALRSTQTLRRLVGNFPQAFSHIALINTAFNLMRGARPAQQRRDA